jgi:hypothetical protein
MAAEAHLIEEVAAELANARRLRGMEKDGAVRIES